MKKIKFISIFAVSLLFLSIMFLGSRAFAATHTLDGDYIINGGLAVRGDIYADHNVINFNPVGYTGVDPTLSYMRGDSQIKEMGDLYVISDDYLHIGPSVDSNGKVLIQTPTEIAAKARTAGGTLWAGKLVAPEVYTGSVVNKIDDSFLYLSTNGSLVLNSDDNEDTDGDILFYTGSVGIGSEAKMTIENSGKVGIGTESPKAELDVMGGGIRIYSTGSKPECNTETRGEMWFTPGATGVTDTFEICAKSINDSYAWRTLWADNPN